MQAWRILLRLVALTTAAMAGAAGVAVAAGLEIRSTPIGTLTVSGSIAAQSCTLAPSGDAYVQSDAPSTNYGTDTLLRVRADAPVRRSFVRFDTASCVPAGARLRSASLSLHLEQATTLSRSYAARRVTGSWTEAGVTWGSQPAVVSQTTATTASGTTAGVRLAWDVTPDVQAFAEGGTTNHGWRLGDVDESGLLLSTGSRFTARESATQGHRPQLTISFYP